MKKLFKLFAVFSLLSLAFISCSDDDDYSLDKYWVSYGTIEGEESNYIIKTDDGSKLHIVSNLLPQYRFKEGQRIIVNYTVLGDVETDGAQINTRGYYVRLNGITEVLTKGTIAQTFIDADAEHRNDSIGNTPIKVDDAWFGDKYLNINFLYYTNPYLQVRHMISLVRDDIKLSDDDEVIITLRHNAYDDLPTSSNSVIEAFGRVSFDLSKVLPVGATSVKVKLVWEEYGDKLDERVTKSSSGIYAPQLASDDKSVGKVVRGAGSGLNVQPKESSYRLDKIATLVE